MKKMNAFLCIGIAGLILTAVFQFLWPELSFNIAFTKSIKILYPLFAAVVIIGIGLMLKVEIKPIDD